MPPSPSWILGIIIIVVIALVAGMLLTTKTKPKTKEHFEDASGAAGAYEAPVTSLNPIDNTLLSTVYQKTGIDRCEALYADVAARPEMREDMTDKARETMDNFILGHRMREWMPASKAEQAKLDKGNKHCYFLFDSNNGAMDPIMNDNTCDMRNPIFQGVEFINKVFVDTDADVAHTLPYTKCVVDIKPDDVDSSTLNYFWSRMGEAQCSNYQQGAQKEVTNLVKIVSSCNNELKAFKDLDPKYRKCMEDQRGLERDLAERVRLYSLSNCAFTGNCNGQSANGSLPTMQERAELLTRQIAESKGKVDVLDRSIMDMQRKTRTDERRLNELNVTYAGISNDYVRCHTTDLPQTKSQLSELQDETGRLTNTSNLLANQYKICTANRIAKTREYEQLITRINNTNALYQGSNSQLITCLSTNDYLRQTITTLKDQVQKFATACNECTSTVVMRIAERDALEQGNLNLTQERDEWLRRCTYDQQKMMGASVQTINQLRSASTQYTRQNCGNDMAEAEAVNDLIKQKFEAIAKAQMPLSCTDENKRSQCCRSIGLE